MDVYVFVSSVVRRWIRKKSIEASSCIDVSKGFYMTTSSVAVQSYTGIAERGRK